MRMTVLMSSKLVYTYSFELVQDDERGEPMVVFLLEGEAISTHTIQECHEQIDTVRTLLSDQQLELFEPEWVSNLEDLLEGIR